MTTQQLRLRAMEPEDLELLYKIENDRCLWNVGSTNVPYSRYVLHDYIATSSGDIYTDRQVRLIAENGVGETVGVADLVDFDAKNLRAEVGIVVMDNQRQKGYATAALRQIADYASSVLHLHQLYAIVDDQNLAAQKLFEKCDFHEIARLQDWLYDGHHYHDAFMMQKIL